MSMSDVLGAGAAVAGGRAGAVLGCVIGEVFGPPGAVVGAILGGKLGSMGGRAAGAWLGSKIDKYNSDADRLSDDKDKARACATCAAEIPCFNVPEKGTREELERQLDEQEDAINGKSPEELEKAIDSFTKRPNDSGVRADERASQLRTRAKSYERQGMTPADAAAKAEAELKNLDVTHALDWRAGGDGTLSESGVGGRSENRSIGSQWNQKGPGSNQSRANDLKDAAAAQKKQGRKNMKVKLRAC